MSHCFLCGQPTPVGGYQFRRRVKTGTTEVRFYSGRKIRSVQTRYGVRVVCTACALGIDREVTKGAIRDGIFLATLVAVAVALILVNNPFQGLAMGNEYADHASRTSL